MPDTEPAMNAVCLLAPVMVSGGNVISEGVS
jgi:hypothetical protein